MTSSDPRPFPARRLAGSTRSGLALWALAVPLILGTLPGLVPAAAADSASPEVLPIPVDVDGQRVRSSMYFSVPVERYDESSLAALSTKSLDSVERAYVELVEGLRTGNVEKVGRSVIGGETSGGAAQKTTLWRSAFGNMEGTRSVARVDLGQDQLFVWDWPSPRGTMRRAFSFDQRTERAELVTSNQPLATLLLDVFQNAVEQPSAYAPLEEADTRFRYSLPVDGEARVSWHFDGEPTDYLLYGEVDPPSLPALVAVRQAHLALAAGDRQTFLDAHTGPSRAKLAGWLAEMPAEEYRSFEMTTLLGKRVRFVLDADPVHILFYEHELEGLVSVEGTAPAATAPATNAPATSSSPPSKRLSWIYVYHDPESGRYLITNAYRQGFVDDFLGAADLFPRDPDGFAKRVLGQSP